MVKVERYKLFFNSKDFEIIYKKSLESLRKELNNENFFKHIVKPALEKRYCFLLYLDGKVIGYQLVQIKKKIIEGGYTFIQKEYRGKKYSKILRKFTYESLKNEIKEVHTFIRKNNIVSMRSVKNLAAELNIEIEEKNIYDENYNLIGKTFKTKNE